MFDFAPSNPNYRLLELGSGTSFDFGVSDWIRMAYSGSVRRLLRIHGSGYRELEGVLQGVR